MVGGHGLGYPAIPSSVIRSGNRWGRRSNGIWGRQSFQSEQQDAFSAVFQISAAALILLCAISGRDRESKKITVGMRIFYEKDGVKKACLVPASKCDHVAPLAVKAAEVRIKSALSAFLLIFP